MLTQKMKYALKALMELAAERAGEGQPLRIEEIDKADYMTPERVREIHRECLADLEQRFGPEYWVYRG